MSDYCTALKYAETLDTEEERQEELNAVLCPALGTYSYECAFYHNIIMDWRTSRICRKYSAANTSFTVRLYFFN